jgi:hypothetical protein
LLASFFLLEQVSRPCNFKEQALYQSLKLLIFRCFSVVIVVFVRFCALKPV